MGTPLLSLPLFPPPAWREATILEPWVMAMNDTQTKGAVIVGTWNWVLHCLPLGLFENKAHFLFKPMLFGVLQWMHLELL